MMMNSKMTHQTTPPLAGEIEGIRTRHEVCANSANRVSPDDLWAAERDRATLLAALEASDKILNTAGDSIERLREELEMAEANRDEIKAALDKAQERIGILEHELDLNEREQLDADDDAGLGAKKLKLAQERIAGLRVALGHMITMLEHSLFGAVNPQGVRWEVGKTDIAITPDGSYMLSDARALLPSPGKKGEVGT